MAHVIFVASLELTGNNRTLSATGLDLCERDSETSALLSSAEGGYVNILSEGQTIRHDQYGIGRVTESNVERTTIDFDDHGVKKFITSIWSAELIGEAPAGRPVRRRGRRKTAKK